MYRINTEVQREKKHLCPWGWWVEDACEVERNEKRGGKGREISKEKEEK